MRSYIHLNDLPQAGYVGGGLGFSGWDEEEMGHKGIPSPLRGDWETTVQTWWKGGRNSMLITPVMEESSWSWPSREEQGYLKAWHQKDMLSQQVLKMGAEEHSTPASGGGRGVSGSCRGNKVLPDPLQMKRLFPSSSPLILYSSPCTICTVTDGHISQGTTCCVQKLSQHTHRAVQARQSCHFPYSYCYRLPKRCELFTHYWLPSPGHGAFQITWRHKPLPTEHNPK